MGFFRKKAVEHPREYAPNKFTLVNEGVKRAPGETEGRDRESTSGLRASTGLLGELETVIEERSREQEELERLRAEQQRSREEETQRQNLERIALLVEDAKKVEPRVEELAREKLGVRPEVVLDPGTLREKDTKIVSPYGWGGYLERKKTIDGTATFKDGENVIVLNATYAFADCFDEEGVHFTEENAEYSYPFNGKKLPVESPEVLREIVLDLRQAKANQKASLWGPTRA